MVEVARKVLFDMCIQAPCLTLPSAYLTKSIVYNYSFREAIRRYVDDVRNRGLMLKFWGLWAPVQCVTFSIIPQHWRITFVAFVSFFWLIILSSTSSKKSTHHSANGDPEAANIDDECAFEDGFTCNMDG